MTNLKNLSLDNALLQLVPSVLADAHKGVTWLDVATSYDINNEEAIKILSELAWAEMLVTDDNARAYPDVFGNEQPFLVFRIHPDHKRPDKAYTKWHQVTKHRKQKLT